ncbi:MAG: twin-arginine translocase subunit TatC [Tidjanibacter sp.]|nr:twin-arginine translocase subunit TatC [Tidjanibacter sp.]
MTFWEHLDELRKVLLRMAALTFVVMAIAFGCKELLFDVVLAPNNPDFVTYRWVEKVLGAEREFEPLTVQMISTNLTTQFVVHLRMALYAGLLIASPYLVWLLFGFISPGLYENERKYVRKTAIWACVAFFIGLLLSYYVIFPFSLQFLAAYRVDVEIVNMFTLNSYVDTLMLMGLMMGVLFEMPVVAWLLAELGVLRVDMLKRYRRHAVVLIVALAAIITPTTDIFTLMLVSGPIYLLYELSVAIVAKVEKKHCG